jgi:hypothetical protein
MAAGVAVTTEDVARAPIATAFAAIVPIDLSSIFHGFGPIPGVKGTREQTGAWDHAGASRIVELSDGSEAREELTDCTAPRHFAYRLGGFTGPFRHLVAGAEGEWWFSEDGAGATRIRWTYAFRPRPGRALLVRAVVAPLWRVNQRRALALCVAAAERAA